MNMKAKFGCLVVLSGGDSLFPALMSFAQPAGGGRGPVPPRPQGPGDIYTAAGVPCVTAHSTTRALFAAYNGPLYQVRRMSDGQTRDIGVVGAVAPATRAATRTLAAQDSFCAGTTCVITTVYDQSGKGNDLLQAPPGLFVGPAKGGFNTLPIADMAPITISGHKAYGVYIMPGMGLRNNNATGLAINDEPQGIYMVFDGKHFDSGCCFNYGNTSTNSRAVGTGTMDTVYFGTSTNWGRGSGPGPWIMSDMEAGLFSGYNARLNEGSPTIDSWRFVTGSVNGGGGNKWDLRGGNAQQGELKTFYSGPRPGSMENDTYFPMHRKGAVQMGNGGDNGNGSAGTFYEGIITAAHPSDEVINAVQANIVSAKYDVERIAVSRVTTFTPGSTQEVTVLFNNTTGGPVSGVKLSVDLPAGWKAVVVGTTETTKSFAETGGSGGGCAGDVYRHRAELGGRRFPGGQGRVDECDNSLHTQRHPADFVVRSVLPVKINEVLLGGGAGGMSQFVELINAGTSEVDLSNWSLVSTPSQWASLELAKIPAGTKVVARRFLFAGPGEFGTGGGGERWREGDLCSQHYGVGSRPRD